jgi:Tol biopolymer transport system component
VALTKLDANFTTHRWPWFLPDGQHFLYLAASHNESLETHTGIFLASLNGGEARLLVHSNSGAAYASGYLLFTRENALMAQPFDAASLSTRGEPVVISGEVHADRTVWHSTYSASQNGSLLYQPGTPGQDVSLNWFDRTGNKLSSVDTANSYNQIQLSPDGKRLAVSLEGAKSSLWIYDLIKKSKTQLTFGEESYNNFAWSPDGSRIAYSASSGGHQHAVILAKSSNGAGDQEQLSGPPIGVQRRPTDWSRDGKYLLYTSGDLSIGSGYDLWILPLFGDRKPFAYVTGPGNQQAAQFSPDGRWVAYTSDESGRPEVYVAAFPSSGAKWQVSTVGGDAPRWRGDGREIFFVSIGRGALMGVTVNGSGSRFEIGETRHLFTPTALFSSGGGGQLTVTSDGQRFLFVSSAETSLPLILVQNWTAELKKK